MHDDELHRGQRKSVTAGAHRGAFRAEVEFPNPNPGERRGDQRRHQVVQPEVTQRECGCEHAGPRYPDTMNEVRYQAEEGGLHGCHDERDRPEPLVEPLGKSVEDQRLACEAYREPKLRREIAFRIGAEDQSCTRACQRADRDRGESTLEREHKQRTDEGKEERRTDPSRDAEHDAHIPGRALLRARRHLARSQPAGHQRCP